MTTLIRALFSIAVVATATAMAPALAAGQVAAQLPDLSIEDLLNVHIQRVFGASERLQPVTEAPSAVTIVTAEDIRRYGYRTLAEILQSVRGFYVTTDRNYSYLGVRGFGVPGDYNSRILLLVNGHKVNDNIYDQANIGSELGIDVAMFERVEIIRGPASSLYGTSAFFAVINLITRSGASLRGLTIDADAGTLGSGLIRASVGREVARGVDLAVSGTYERTSGVGRLYFPAFDTPETNQGVAENLDGERVRQAYARLRVHDIAITFADSSRFKAVPTASFETLFNSQDPREQTTDRHTLVDARYEHTAGRTHIAADLSFDRLRYAGVYPYPGVDGGGPLLVNDDGAIGARWGAEGQVTRPVPGRQTLTAGAEFFANITQKQTSTYRDPLVPGFAVDQSSNQNAVYLLDEVRVRPWLLLNGGLRHDRYERFARTTPRGAVIVIPAEGQSFKYLYGRAFRAPNAYELYYYADATSYLRPESIGTHELVWEQYVGEWLRTSVSGYRYAASRLLTLAVTGPDGTLGFVNHGAVLAKGLEIEGEVRSKRGFELLASYSSQQAEDDGGRRVTNSPRTMAKLRLSASGPFAGSVGAFEVQYLSSRTTLAGSLVAAATVASATFSARLTKRLELVAAVRNLFNERYFDPASAEHVPDAIEQNGRTARIGLRWNLWRGLP